MKIGKQKSDQGKVTQIHDAKKSIISLIMSIYSSLTF